MSPTKNGGITTTLSRVADIVRSEIKLSDKEAYTGLCHGTRNGFEQGFLNKSPDFKVIGTDISETTSNYQDSVQWDFHEMNPEWISAFDFVYSNSLDQSWKPRDALMTWLNQLKPNGLVIVEHTETHGLMNAGEMDPFGVRPIAMPYVLTLWFGHQITIAHSVAKKSNNGINAWLFAIKKAVEIVE